MTIVYGSGYRPGLLGWCVEQHGRYYAENWGFAIPFETMVAADMAGFFRRLEGPKNHIFWAVDDAGLIGTVSVDAGGAESGLSHVRWFITHERARGKGVGRQLFSNLLDTARLDQVTGLFLWTFQGLEAARTLYEQSGFRLAREQRDRTWGVEVLEQRFELRF